MFSKKSEVASANASVITANASPRARSVGMPDDHGEHRAERARRRAGSTPVSTCQRAAIVPATAAPKPTNAIWPRLTWPAQPVSTTSDSPIIA